MAGAFTNGVIRLDTNPTGVYYSGQMISGSILFDLDQPITFSVIYMQFLGEANVLWTENEIETINGVKRTKIVKYVGREEYFNCTQQLAGGTGTSHLPAGGQTFPFTFQIPFTAPSSYKGAQGEVSYSMTACLVYAHPSILKEEMTKHFQVVAPFDLNIGSPRIKQPIDLEFEEVYGCDCFCSPDPVTIRIRLPISGYCPGQTIPVAVEVQNESSVEIIKMVFQIITRELYRSQRPASEYILPEKVLLTTKKGPVMAHCKRNFTCDLVVPEILPPYLENCSIIDVGYFFRITIKLSGCNDELQDEAEICLGLVPVREFTEGEYVHPLAASLPTGPIPVPDANSQLTVPPATSNTSGSNTSLHRVQYNAAQTAPYQNNPPPYPTGNLPYPSGNLPYPTENKFQSPVAGPQPFCDYQIGFKAPEGVSYQSSQNCPPYPSTQNPPYPSTQNPPYPSTQNPPPYPRENLPPGAAQPYPPGNGMPQGNSGMPPYALGGVGPSAPPPTD